MIDLKKLLTACGAVLLIAAVVLCLYNVVDSGRAGAQAEAAQISLSAYIDAIPARDDTAETPTFPGEEPPVTAVDEIEYIGVLELPDLGLTLPVVSCWNYDLLQVAPCRYSGSPYDDSLVICAHNYSTHFGRIGELTVGAEAKFTDMNGRVFAYRLAEQETVDPNEGGKMTDSGYALTLFTCNWNGTQRVTLRFDRAEDNASM